MSNDPVQEKIKELLKELANKYKLNAKEIKELEYATVMYDYEANEGCIITKEEHIINLFRDPETDEKFTPTTNQIQALAEFIRDTEQYYTFWGFENKTDDVIKSILEKEENKKIKKDRGDR